MPTFFRLTTDHARTDVPLEETFAGPFPSACWLIGGGASLAALPLDLVERTPIPRMAINLSGTGLIRPTFWTSYDPTARFHRSIYLDPGIMKFVHRRRAMDLVPDSTFKVCECPNLYFFDRIAADFQQPLNPAEDRLLDWADSMVQAIAILYRLGFRTIYLIGCELKIPPPQAWRDRAAARGVETHPDETLGTFLGLCQKAGLSREELQSAAPLSQYHFDEAKPLDAAITTDFHYFRIVQYLRLCRVAFARDGLSLVSATPGSRLNAFFPYRPVEQIAAEIRDIVGPAGDEPTRGKYSDSAPSSLPLPPMRDFRPPQHAAAAPPHVPPAPPVDDNLIVAAEGPAAPQRNFADCFLPPEEA